LQKFCFFLIISAHASDHIITFTNSIVIQIESNLIRDTPNAPLFNLRLDHFSVLVGHLAPTWF